MDLNLNEDAEEEVAALRSLYCKANEFSLRKDSDPSSSQILVMICPDLTEYQSQGIAGNASIQFVLPPDYPQSTIKNVIITCSCLTQNTLDQVQEHVDQKLNSSSQNPMLMMELTCFAQELLTAELDQLGENLLQSQKKCSESVNSRLDMTHSEAAVEDIVVNNESECLTSDNSSLESGKSGPAKKPTQQLSGPCDKDTYITALSHLDHMRCRQNYVKLIKKWVSELALTGRLLFCQRCVLILLQGTTHAVKEYIVRNRTTNVDVDSRGRSCKERMLSVLFEGSCQEHIRFTDFSVEEGPYTIQDLKERFHSFSMDSLYMNFVLNIR